MAVLRNRLVVLHHFSDLFCPLVPLFHLSALQLRTLVVPAVKEAAFRKVCGRGRRGLKERGKGKRGRTEEASMEGRSSLVVCETNYAEEWGSVW